MIKSRILLREKTINLDPHVNANEEYYVAYHENLMGELTPMLFTDHEIKKAMDRAAKNPEDVKRADKGFLKRVYDWFFS